MIKQITSYDIRNGFESLKEDLEKQIHKQQEIHYTYVELNETHVSEIEQQLRTVEESIKKVGKSIKRNSICINILIAGLFCAGVAVLALIYHILTI